MPHGGILSAPNCEGIQLMLLRLPVFWLTAFLLFRLLPRFRGMACWNFGTVYSGATAQDFHLLP
jgi:hypothetical protein